ncbi:MAG TPA: hypothetical protein VMI53_09865 [Opitutaceae bacterium]|nr:hypothetical protein [Opitutaceae bacterium]
MSDLRERRRFAFGRWFIVAGGAMAGAVAARYLVLGRPPRAAPPAPGEVRAPVVVPAAPPSRTAAPARLPSMRTASFEEVRELLLRKMADGASPAELLALLHEMAADQPALAIALAQDLGRSDDEKAAWVTALVHGWASRDPDAAWRWLVAQADHINQLANGSLIKVVLDQMAARDPQLLIKNADALLRAGDQFNGLPSQIVAQAGLEALVKNGDLDAACALIKYWSACSYHPDIGAGAYATVALELAKRSPADATAWLTSLPVSDDRNAALGSVAADWVSRDPAAALRWSETLAPADGRSAVTQRAFSEWMETSPADAEQWLGNQLVQNYGGPENDALIMNFINQSALIRNDPASAMQWVDLIADPVQQSQAREQMVLRWGQRDLSAAVAYVNSSSAIDPQRKDALLSALRSQSLSPTTSPVWFSSDSFGP